MTKKALISPTFEKGRFDGLVVEGKSLWRKFTFITELAENTKPAKT